VLPGERRDAVCDGVDMPAQRKVPVALRRRTLAAVSGAIALAACGQSGQPAGTGGGPSCADANSNGEVKVQGTVGGQTVAIDQSPSSGVFSQLPSGSFDTPLNVTINDASVTVTPSVVQIHLTWSSLVANGNTAGAMGSITLPEGQPYAQMALCAGSGSTITPTDQGLDFDLKGLTQGTGCTESLSGELRGCWGWAHGD
jgi:hypothetical protein